MYEQNPILEAICVLTCNGDPKLLQKRPHKRIFLMNETWTHHVAGIASHNQVLCTLTILEWWKNLFSSAVFARNRSLVLPNACFVGGSEGVYSLHIAAIKSLNIVCSLPPGPQSWVFHIASRGSLLHDGMLIQALTVAVRGPGRKLCLRISFKWPLRPCLRGEGLHGLISWWIRNWRLKGG